MKHLRRLTEGAGTAFQRRLLESARQDASPKGSMSAVAARLGLQLSGAELEGSRREDCSVPAEAGLKNAGSGALLKYSVIAIVCGSLGGSSTSDAALSDPASPTSAPMVASSSALVSSEPDATSPPEPARAAPQDVAVSDAAALGADEPTRAPEAKPLPRASQSAAAGAAQSLRAAALPSPSEPRGGASAASAAGLLAEVQKLDRVRAALAAFDSQAALDELDHYDRSFPRGELALEAIVLRVQALRSAGQFAPAARLARRALELPGSDRYRARLARLIEPE